MIDRQLIASVAKERQFNLQHIAGVRDTFRSTHHATGVTRLFREALS